MFPLDAVLSAAIGAIIGLLIALPAIIIELREKNGEHHDLPIIVDAKPFWEKSFTHRERVFTSVLIHVLGSALFGFLYPVFAVDGWFFLTGHPYSLVSLLVYSVGAWLIAGLILFPLIGFGFFGTKEDDFVPFEILFMMLVLGVGLWLAVQWFQPSFFV